MTEQEKKYIPDEDEKVIQIEVERLTTFKDHPFRVQEDSDMKLLMESIEKFGILSSLIVRPMKEGVYEIISGHRRRFTAEKLGYRKVPVIIRVMRDEESIIAMVDANLQRDKISFSEKAFAYKMKNDAMKRVRGRKKRGQPDDDLKGKRTIEIIAEQSGESYKQIQRYIKITALHPTLFNMLLKQMPYQEVRAKKMPIRIEYYKQIHLDKMDKEETVMGIWKKTKVFTEVSDVFVMNKSRELSCYYIDEEHPYRITGFIQLNPTGSIIIMDTKD